MRTLCLVSLVGVVAASDCSVILRGYHYALEDIAGTVYETFTGNIKYKAAVCGSDDVIGDECRVSKVVAAIGDSCEYLARAVRQPTLAFVNGKAVNGITLKYLDGKQCGESPSLNYSTTFVFNCAEDDTNVLQKVLDPEEVGIPCNFEYHFSTSAACPTFNPSTPQDTIWSIVIIILLITIYCSFGAMYKRRKGASGIEMVPHIDAWRKITNSGYRKGYRTAPTSEDEENIYEANHTSSKGLLQQEVIHQPSSAKVNET